MLSGCLQVLTAHKIGISVSHGFQASRQATIQWIHVSQPAWKSGAYGQKRVVGMSYVMIILYGTV